MSAGMALAAVQATTALTQQNISIAVTKQQLEAQKAVVSLVSQAADTGAQALNSGGRGQVVNLLT